MIPGLYGPTGLGPGGAITRFSPVDGVCAVRDAAISKGTTAMVAIRVLFIGLRANLAISGAFRATTGGGVDSWLDRRKIGKFHVSRSW
jgi:hypothetical protein